MGLSSSLLLVAVMTAALPMLATRLTAPSSIRDLEKIFVVGVVTAAVGGFVASRIHPFDVFAVIHLGYLLVVVTVPVMFIGWYVISIVFRKRSLLTRICGLVGLVVAMLGVWATHIEPNWLETDRATLVAAVPQPLRIGVLADMQTPNIGRHEQNAIATLIAEQPDLVVVPGDLFQGPGEVIETNTADFTALLAELVAETDLVAVVSGDSDDKWLLEPMVTAVGALFIDNSIQEVVVGGQTVRLAGVEVFASRDRLETLAALGEQSDALTVLISHRPDVVFELPLNTDVDLIIAGHTHGGQISLPLFGPPVTFSDVPQSVAAGGLGVVDTFPVYVSTGVGLERNNAPQVRFGARPSVGIIDIVPN